MPSLALNIPPGNYEYSVLETGWSKKLKLNTQKFNNTTWEKISSKGRSTENLPGRNLDQERSKRNPAH